MTDNRSPEAAAFRGWYKLRRWKKLREQHLTINPLCEMCINRKSSSRQPSCTIGKRTAGMPNSSGIQTTCRDCARATTIARDA